MALGRHVDADKLVAESKDHPIKKHQGKRADLHDLPYASRYDVQVDMPKYQMPEEGCDPNAIYQLLHDELLLGMSPALWYGPN